MADGRVILGVLSIIIVIIVIVVVLKVRARNIKLIDMAEARSTTTATDVDKLMSAAEKEKQKEIDEMVPMSQTRVVWAGELKKGEKIKIVSRMRGVPDSEAVQKFHDKRNILTDDIEDGVVSTFLTDDKIEKAKTQFGVLRVGVTIDRLFTDADEAEDQKLAKERYDIMAANSAFDEILAQQERQKIRDQRSDVTRVFKNETTLSPTPLQAILQHKASNSQQSGIDELLREAQEREIRNDAVATHRTAQQVAHVNPHDPSMLEQHGGQDAVAAVLKTLNPPSVVARHVLEVDEYQTDEREPVVAPRPSIAPVIPSTSSTRPAVIFSGASHGDISNEVAVHVPLLASKALDETAATS